MERNWHQLSGTERKEMLTADQVKARNVARPDGKRWVPCEPPAKDEVIRGADLRGVNLDGADLVTPRIATRIEITETPAPSAPAAKAETTNAGTTAAPVAAKDTVMAKKKAKAGKPKTKPVKKAVVAKANKPASKRPRNTWQGHSRAALFRYNGAAGVSAWKSTQIAVKLGLLPADTPTWYNAWREGKEDKKTAPVFDKETKAKWHKVADSITDKPTKAAKLGKAKTAKGKPVKAAKATPKPKAKKKPETAPMDPDAAIMAAQETAESLVSAAAE